jgi:hypothetical protein
MSNEQVAETGLDVQREVPQSRDLNFASLILEPLRERENHLEWWGTLPKHKGRLLGDQGSNIGGWVLLLLP